MATKVSFFTWCAVNNEIVTIDNLIWRWMFMVNQSCVCLRDEESVTHLFTYCLVAKEFLFRGTYCGFPCYGGGAYSRMVQG